MDIYKLTVSEIQEILDVDKNYNTIKEGILKQIETDKRKTVRDIYRRILTLRENHIKEVKRLTRMYEYEQKYWNEGCKAIAGVDEAGRGPLAGPVVAAAVIFKQKEFIHGLNDSKKISETQRFKLERVIRKKALAWQIGIVNNNIIDEINIRNATFMAMEKAVMQLAVKSDLVLVDGCDVPQLPIVQIPLIKGDQHSASIAAASILAKCARDRLMHFYHKKYQNYDFVAHKGYGTTLHYEKIHKHGLSPVHRKTFIHKGI